MKGAPLLAGLALGFAPVAAWGGKLRFQALEAGTSALAEGKGPVMGDGDHGYRLRLLDPADGVTPLVNRPYAFWVPHHDLPFVVDDKDVFQGVTDAEGYTAIFRLNHRLDDRRLELSERIGAGDHGITMRVTDQRGRPLARLAYLAVMCSDHPSAHRGVSNDKGETAYFASDAPIEVKLLLAVDAGGGDDVSGATAACGGSNIP